MAISVPPASEADRKLAAKFGFPESTWLQVDLELNRQKITDPLRQREADRASADEAMLRAMLREAS